jgi:drug/metabolite transporter (DMT)-like permease
MCVVWGIPYLFIKVAVGGVAPPVVVFARTAGGAAILLPVAAFTGRAEALRIVRRHWRPLLVFAALEMIGPWLLLSDAERRLSSSMAGLLIAAVPITGIVVARLTGGTERLSRARWLGLLVGLAGVAVLAAPHLEGGDAWAVVEVLLVAVGYASAPLVAARKLTAVPTLPLIAACLTLAALVYTPAALLTWPQSPPSGQVVGALVALATCCTALAFMVFPELIREVGTSRAMVFTDINPDQPGRRGRRRGDRPRRAPHRHDPGSVRADPHRVVPRHRPPAAASPAACACRSRTGAPADHLTRPPDGRSAAG